jgi:parvulin-like peptidyl-prolyl isomerase
MGEWVKREGIDKNPEYQENSRMAHEMIERQLALQAFQTKLLKEVAISDAEAKSFYDKNKATDQTFKRPPFLVKAAGVKAQAIVVDTEKEAKDVLAQVKAGDINSASKKANKAAKDLGVVNPQSYGVDNAVKTKIISFKTFPAKDMVKGSDGKFYVIEATGSQNAEYAPFEEVKEQLKQLITSQKLGELFAKRAEELKAQYKIEINPNFIKSMVSKPAQETESPVKMSNGLAA